MNSGTESKGICLVTGGAGFIGSHLVDELLGRGCRVRVLDNLATGKPENLAAHRGNPAFDFVEGSILDSGCVERSLDGVSRVFHLACLGVRHSIRFPMENHRINAEGTLLLLEAVRCRGGLDRFVHVSSSEIYGTAMRDRMNEEHPAFPHTVYGASKLAGECYARASYLTWGMPVVIVRPFNVFGPRSHFEGDAGELIPKSVLRALTGRPILIFGDGKQQRDFTYCTDTAGAIADIGFMEDMAGRTLNIGTGSAPSIRDIAEMILRLTPGTNAGMEYTEARPGDVQRLLCDNSLIVRELGFKPRVTLEEGLSRVVEWFRSNEASLADWITRDTGANWK